MPKIPINPIMEGYLSALKSVSAKSAPKVAKAAKKAAAPKAVRKVAKRAVVARPKVSRVEKTAANIRKSYPNLPEAEVMKRANMTKGQRSAYLSEQHSAASATAASTKAAERKAKQEANRAAWAEKQRAKMNRYDAYKASNPSPVKKAAKKARGKRGVK